MDVSFLCHPMALRRKMLESLSFVPNSSALISAHALTERNGSFKKKNSGIEQTDPFLPLLLILPTG